MRIGPFLLSAALLLPVLARADDAPEPADISKVKSELKIFTDGKQHYIALVPFGDTWEHFYYGDGKTFHKQRVQGGGRSGTESFDRTFWDPRWGSGVERSFGLHNAKYSVSCGKRETEFKLLPDIEAAKILETAKYFGSRWNRRAYALARDDLGNYYFVDKQREPEDSKNFRLFSGPKGNIKLLKMTNVVSDSAGEIFATKTGELRLILNKGEKNESRWIQNKVTRKLLILSVEDNAPMIYTDLGVYAGMKLGTPCDDL